MKTKARITFILKRMIFLFFSLLPFFLAGCDTVSEDAYVFVKNSDYVYINFDLAERVVIKEERFARTITAPEIDLSDSSYHYYIWGKSNKSTVNPQKVNFDSTNGSSGTIPLDFPVTTYYFTLVATAENMDGITDSSEILKKAILVAYTGADLSYSTIVQFHLSTKGLNYFGDMNLSFCLDSSWTPAEISDLNSNYNVTVGLFEIDTGDPVDSFPSAATLSGLNASAPVALDTYSAMAGTYNLVVSIKKTGSTKKYTYSDTIIVAPNRGITETIMLPNVIEYPPEAPSNFKAAYCLDERIYYDTKTLSDGAESTETAEAASENEYALLLSWNDNSNNESNFKVTLAAVSKMTPMPSVPATMTDADWARIVTGYNGTSSVVKVYDEKCIHAENYYAGSLEKNNTSLILYVPFDVCYVAKIEAVNDAGISSACYATLNSDFNVEVYDEGYGNNTAIYEGKAFSTVQNPCSVINLYKIVYHFSGGTMEYTESSALKTDNGPFVDYGVYGTYSFFCPTSELADATKDSPALLYLYSGSDATFAYGSRWTHWKIDSFYGTDLTSSAIGGSDVTLSPIYTYQKPNDYTGYKSLYLFARYD